MRYVKLEILNEHFKYHWKITGVEDQDGAIQLWHGHNPFWITRKNFAMIVFAEW